MRAEAEADQVVFDRLQDELKRATAINDKMTRIHSERDSELEHYRRLVSSLLERWQAVFAQIDARQRELELLGRHMHSYRESYDWLIRWLAEAKQRQEKIQAVPIGDGKALKEQLAQEKVLHQGGKVISLFSVGYIDYAEFVRIWLSNMVASSPMNFRRVFAASWSLWRG